MEIPINLNQQNTTVSSEAEFQTWGPIPAVTNYTYNTNTGNLPVVLPTVYTLKDFMGTPQAEGYSALRCKIRRMPGSPSPVNWFSVDELPVEDSTELTISPLVNGSTRILTNQLSNLNLLPVGVYTKNIKFYVSGYRPWPLGWQSIEVHNHQIRLTVSDELFTFDPSSLNFVHLAGTLPMPEKELTISGSSWRLVIPPKFEVTTDETEGVVISIAPVILNRLVDGTGTRTIKIKLSENYNDDPTPSTAPGNFSLSSGGTFIAQIPYSITLLDISNVINVQPSNIVFNAIKSILEPTPLFVEVSTILEYTYVFSPWLIVTSGQNEIDGVLKDGLWIVPIPTQNMDDGTYNGFVDLFLEYESEPISIRIEVLYNLLGFIASPYDNKNAFTLDTAFYQLHASNDLVYYDVKQEIKTFGFFTDQEKNNIIPEKYPLYNRKSKFNVGERIHRLMDKFSEPNEFYHQYRPAEISITVLEKLQSDNSIQREVFLPIQKFVAGLSDNVTTPFSFLDVNPNMKRVTKNSYELLNILIPSEPVNLKLYRNNIFVSEEELPLSFGKIVTKKVTFENFQQGDVIKYTLSGSEELENEISKSFAIIPEGRYSNNIVWQNEFLVQSVLECTGSFASETEFGITSMEKFKNLVEVLDYLEVRKKSKFTLNTGWLLKNDQISIESLMASKRIWIKHPNGDWLSLRPLTKKLVNTDSERELIDFNLEFQLNRNNNAKTYSW